MRKHVVDTDLYISHLRTGVRGDRLKRLYSEEAPGLYFSSVVAEELLAGVTTSDGRRAVEDLIRPFERVGRIVTPSHAHWRLGGEFLAWAYSRLPGLRSRLSRLTNDVLIALSSQSIGATLHTSNRRDFEAIQSWKTLSINYVGN